MKKFIVFCLMAFVMCVNANAQERVNGEIYTFQNSSEQLTTFTGYVYSDIEEQWYANCNCLSESYVDGKNAYTIHNIQSMQIKTFTYKNKKYYVLMCGYNSYRWEYPALEIGLIRIYKITNFLLTEEDYKALFSDKEYQTFKWTSLLTYSETEYTENKFIRLLFSDNKLKMITVPNSFTIQKYKDVVRFIFSGDGPQMSRYLIKKEYYEIPSDEWLKLYIE